MSNKKAIQLDQSFQKDSSLRLDCCHVMIFGTKQGEPMGIDKKLTGKNRREAFERAVGWVLSEGEKNEFEFDTVRIVFTTTQS